MKLISIFCVCSFICSVALAQDTHPTDSTISTYVHIKIKQEKWLGMKPPDTIINFVITNVDTSGAMNWTSQKITDFEKDSNEYFIRLDVPENLVDNSKNMWCTATGIYKNSSGVDTVPIRYGGVTLSKIKLILKSSPEGAETFLVPNRIWLEKFENTPLDKNEMNFQKFRVNTSNTNTYAYVDETVFVIVYKMNGRYKTVIHNTKPETVEQEQTVWVNF